MTDAAATLRRMLRDPEYVPEFTAPDDTATLIRVATRERVIALVGARLRAFGQLERWPKEFREACNAAERQTAAIDCIRQTELMRVLRRLHAAGIRVLLFKGAALAHTHYPAPHARERTDTDLLIPASDRAALAREVTHLDYQPQQETSGGLVSHQSHYGRYDRHGLFHALDVHWKVSNRHALANRFTFEELWSRRVPLGGGRGEVVAAVDALLLAAVHRVGHHPGSTDLRWAYDLHLLTMQMTAVELHEASELAVAKGLAAVIYEGLATAQAWFGAPGLAFLTSSLRAAAGQTSASDVLPARWNQIDVVRHDLRALDGWSARGRLVREHLFPPASYMRGKYGVQSAIALPALYAWRIVAGAPRWLRRRDAAG